MYLKYKYRSHQKQNQYGHELSNVLGAVETRALCGRTRAITLK